MRGPQKGNRKQTARRVVRILDQTKGFFSMELFELAKHLGAEVEPVQRRRKRVTSQTIDCVLTTLEDDAMDHHAFMLKLSFILQRQRNDMNIMTEVDERTRHSSEVIG